MKKKINMQQGVRYKGYATINEYGEIMFEPEQTGARAGVVKIVFKDEDFSIKTTENLILVNLRVSKGLSPLKQMYELSQIIDKILKKFREYEL